MLLQRSNTDGHQVHEKLLSITHLGKCKSKAQTDVTLHLPEWLSDQKHKE